MKIILIIALLVTNLINASGIDEVIELGSETGQEVVEINGENSQNEWRQNLQNELRQLEDLVNLSIESCDYDYNKEIEQHATETNNLLSLLQADTNDEFPFYCILLRLELDHNQYNPLSELYLKKQDMIIKTIEETSFTFAQLYLDQMLEYTQDTMKRYYYKRDKRDNYMNSKCRDQIEQEILKNATFIRFVDDFDNVRFVYSTNIQWTAKLLPTTYNKYEEGLFRYLNKLLIEHVDFPGLHNKILAKIKNDSATREISSLDKEEIIRNGVWDEIRDKNNTQWSMG